MIGASSLVEGDGLSLRGDEYGFGPLHAAVLSLVLWVSSDLEAAYPWFKVVNALFWALTAVPVYLLARRLVSQWWAVLAAGLTVAIPSSISVATVMTESMAFLAAAWALYATMLALERPTVLRQLVLLAAIGVAFLTRSQLGVLYVGWLVALGLHWWISPAARPRGRADWRRLWPSALPLLAAVAFLAARLVGGTSPRDSLGAYWELWRGYDPFGVAKWIVYHLADIEIYLAVIPLAVAPIVLTQLVRRGRAGTAVDSAFASLFLAANATGLLVVAAFTSTPWGYDRLHDRYAFYLLPLWLIVFVVWLADGLPRPLVATATGVVLALVLPAILPFRQLANEAGIDTVPGALWVWVEAQVAGPGPLSGSRLLAAFVIALLLAVLFLPETCRGSAGRRRSRRAARHERARLGAPDRRAGGRRVRGRARAVVDRRSRARGRARHEAVHRHATAVRRSRATRCSSPRRSTRPSIAPRTSATRLPDGLPDRASRRRRGRHATPLAGRTADARTTSSPSRASSSRASGSRPGRTRSSSCGARTAPCVVAGATSNDELSERDCA